MARFVRFRLYTGGDGVAALGAKVFANVDAIAYVEEGKDESTMIAFVGVTPDANPISAKSALWVSQSVDDVMRLIGEADA